MEKDEEDLIHFRLQLLLPFNGYVQSKVHVVADFDCHWCIECLQTSERKRLISQF